MSDLLNVQATTREDIGKGASRRLRHEKNVPAVVYGAGKEAVSLTLELKEVMKHVNFEKFFSSILTLTIDGKGEGEKVVIRDLQRPPFRDEVMHMDFQRVAATKPLTMRIPVHFEGEAVSPGALAGGGFRHILNEIELRGLAKNMPEFVKVDLSKMDVSDTVMLSDLDLPKGIDSVMLARGESHNSAVVICSATKK
jgi:large subunit ribosomal protein L25